MKFFKPEDFDLRGLITCYEAADFANTKLERDGKVVYGGPNNIEYGWDTRIYRDHSHKALLINIEPISEVQEERPIKEQEQINNLAKSLYGMFKHTNQYSDALLKAIELIDMKKNCKHPSANTGYGSGGVVYCDYCGKKLQAKTVYEEIE